MLLLLEEAVIKPGAVSEEELITSFEPFRSNSSAFFVIIKPSWNGRCKVLFFFLHLKKNVRISYLAISDTFLAGALHTQFYPA